MFYSRNNWLDLFRLKELEKL